VQVSLLVLLECEWVLRGRYGLSQEPALEEALGSQVPRRSNRSAAYRAGRQSWLAGYPSRTLCLVLGSKSARRAELKDGVVLVIPSIRRLAREIARLRPYPRRTCRGVGVSPSDSGSLFRRSLLLGAIQPPQHRGQGDRQQKHHHGGVHHKSWGVPHAECRRVSRLLPGAYSTE
jgi:hypothetical protein